MKMYAEAVSGIAAHPPANFATGGCGADFPRERKRAWKIGAADRPRLLKTCEQAGVAAIPRREFISRLK